MQGQKAVLRNLQKTFKGTSNLCSSINGNVKESKKCLETLSNIEEQYVCCNKVDFARSPYKEYPTLKEDLVYKLIMAFEGELQKLKNCMSEFSIANDKIQKQTDALFALYQRYSDQLSADDLMEGSPTRPSIGVMMEWAQTIQQSFYVQYCKRKHLLQHINYDKPATVTQLVDEWCLLEGITEIVRDILPWVKFFIEEDI